VADEDLELVYLTLDDALELYAAITGSTSARLAATLRARSTLEGALARPATYAHYQDADISLQAAVLAHGIAEKGYPDHSTTMRVRGFCGLLCGFACRRA
jgi:hypothetical protein